MTTTRLIADFVLLLGTVLCVGCGPRDETAGRPPEGKEPAPKSALQPEDWPGLFTERLDAGDLDGIMALYDPDARFVPPAGGEPLVGRDRIRPVVAGLIAAKARFRSRVVRTVTVDDVAVLYTDFQVMTVEAAGKTVEVHQKAIEVLRRQPDGEWLLIVGDPNGRGR